MASRVNIVKTDLRVDNCSRGLESIASNVRGILPPTSSDNFFNDLQMVFSSQTLNEAFYIPRINRSFTSLSEAFNRILSSSNALSDIAAVATRNDVKKLENNFQNIADSARNVVNNVAVLGSTLRSLRNNRTVFGTPTQIRDRLDESMRDETIQNLRSIRNSVEFIMTTLKDVTRVSTAQGSIYDMISRNSGESERSSTLNNFNNTYNENLNLVLSNATAYNRSSHTNFNSLVNRIRTRFNDEIIRPAFEADFHQKMVDFFNSLVPVLFNLENIQSTLDTYKDAILNSASDELATIAELLVENREKIFDLLKTPYFATFYSTCLDDLVSDLLNDISNSFTRKRFCIDVRASAISGKFGILHGALITAKKNFDDVLSKIRACTLYPSSQLTTAKYCFAIVSNHEQFFSVCALI